MHLTNLSLQTWNQLRLIHHGLGTQTLSTIRKEEVYCIGANGRKISFVQAQDLPDKLSLFLEILSEKLTKSQRGEEKAQIDYLTFFWIGFISLHPFSNGNGRVAKKFISDSLKRWFKDPSLDEGHLNFLNQTLLTEDAQKNTEIISHHFNTLFKRKKNEHEQEQTYTTRQIPTYTFPGHLTC